MRHYWENVARTLICYLQNKSGNQYKWQRSDKVFHRVSQVDYITGRSYSRLIVFSFYSDSFTSEILKFNVYDWNILSRSHLVIPRFVQQPRASRREIRLNINDMDTPSAHKDVSRSPFESRYSLKATVGLIYKSTVDY